MVEILGFAAAFCTTFAFVPQALKTIQSRETASISLWMYAIFTTGVFLWLIYGLAIHNWPVIISNAMTFALAGTILWFKIKYP